MDIWAGTCDFQQCGILTSVDSDESVQPPFKIRNSKWCSVCSLTVILTRLAKALISLRVCAGWSEPLLVAHTTLLEISYHHSFKEWLEACTAIQWARCLIFFTYFQTLCMRAVKGTGTISLIFWLLVDIWALILSVLAILVFEILNLIQYILHSSLTSCHFSFIAPLIYHLSGSS